MPAAYPKVELVQHIPYPGHPLGRYVRERRRVELSRKELEGRSSVERRFALYHELGHWWRTEHFPDRLMRGTHDEEEFADMFALFFVGGETGSDWTELFSQDISPELKNDVEAFAQHVLEQLDEELAR